MNPSILYALSAAVLFGASTPFAKLVVDEASPVLLAGLLYVGSGIGLALLRLIRDRGWKPTGLAASEWRWLSGAILFGGVIAPVALLFGLIQTTGSTAALLLNLEAVLTAVIAWIVYKENADRRIVTGMVLIAAGGVVLSWPTTGADLTGGIGPLSIAFACLCWAIDNNLTRKVSGSDVLFIAGSKGVIAGFVNCTLAFSLGEALPAADTALSMIVIGLLGYGASLALFVLALRGLGAARTGAYFYVAPFIGAAVALVVLDESLGPLFWTAAVLMAAGVWLHLTERHEHEHRHEALEHQHDHTHDEHHQHTHDGEWDGTEPHDHRHSHAAIVHKHPHFPDIHHRHAH